MNRIQINPNWSPSLGAYFNNGGRLIERAGFAYAKAAYGNASLQAFGLPLWLGPRPVAVAFTLPPDNP